MRRDADSAIARYDRVAERAAAIVISGYSTSFGTAARLLSPNLRRSIRAIYALVRVADEIVDGSASEAGLSDDELLEVLNGYEHETERAIERGYSADVIVHAFARTARDAGIDTALTRPFFASMRRDLDTRPFTSAEIGPYIHGSAEVVGLMCLRAFLVGESIDAAERARLENGAIQLGAAFQKVNFLRDFGEDWRALGRNYFPWVEPANFDEAAKNAVLDDIDADLAAAAATIPALPRSSRGAVRTAHAVFEQLAQRCRRTPAAQLLTTRIRVPDAEKATIALTSILRSQRSSR